MGIRMSGTPICAITLPSRNSTIEWTTDWGWITTSIREVGRPNSHVASITSSPLFMRVAEATETFAPLPHRGGPRPRRRGHELPGHHEKLLVRQGDPLPLFRGGDDRTDRGDPGRRGEDDVDVSRARRLPHPLFAE